MGGIEAIGIPEAIKKIEQINNQSVLATPGDGVQRNKEVQCDTDKADLIDNIKGLQLKINVAGIGGNGGSNLNDAAKTSSPKQVGVQ